MESGRSDRDSRVLDALFEDFDVRAHLRHLRRAEDRGKGDIHAIARHGPARIRDNRRIARCARHDAKEIIGFPLRVDIGDEEDDDFDDDDHRRAAGADPDHRCSGLTARSRSR